MKAQKFVLAAYLLLGLTALASGDDKKPGDKAANKEKLVGVWEPQGKDTPPGATLEFTKDGKIKVHFEDKGQVRNIDGTYKVDGETLTVTFRMGDQERKEKLKIKALTDQELVTVGSKGKAETFKRKKK
jgi:uncharacterized protein (TIGR03066 family)